VGSSTSDKPIGLHAWPVNGDSFTISAGAHSRDVATVNVRIPFLTAVRVFALDRHRKLARCTQLFPQFCARERGDTFLWNL
jgi:hypothetical protein